MTRRGLLVRLALLAGAGTGAWWLRDNVLWPPPIVGLPHEGPTGWFDFAMRDLVPTLEVSLKGRTVNALIDSGAQRSVIDRDLHRALQLGGGFDIPMVAYGVDGRAQVGRGIALEARAREVQLSRLRAAILDLGPLADAEGLNAPLILGQDFLQAVMLEVDTAARRLRLHRPGTPLPADATPAPLRASRWGLEVEVSVEGHALSALVDTGASALLSVRRSAAEAAGLMDGRPQDQTTSIVLGGETGAVVVQAQSVTAAGRNWGPKSVAVYADGGTLGLPEALLGMEAFRGATLWLDFGRKQLAIRRTASIDLGL